MQKRKLFLSFLAICSWYLCNAQTAIIENVAGTGAFGSYGEGVPANTASMQVPSGIAIDALGNLYFADVTNPTVRKVTPDGVITRYAGTALSSGFSGDGGPANVAQLSNPEHIAIDAAGNLYIADNGNNRIRKVSTSGIITTIAGTGTGGYTGDGGPATAAEIGAPYGIVVDTMGNIYFSDNRDVVRKINTSGIISTIAGTGTGGFSGDGGLATIAQIANPAGLALDHLGNLYIADAGNERIRKIDTGGIIHTIAGSSFTGGYGGDGGPATSALLYTPISISADAGNNLYIMDYGNQMIRKIDTAGIIKRVSGYLSGPYTGDGQPAISADIFEPGGLAVDAYNNLYLAVDYVPEIRKIIFTPPIVSDSFYVYVNELCAGPQISLISRNYSAGQSVVTDYGDGTSSTTSISSGIVTGYGLVSHTYLSPGTFTIKHVLYDGALAVDSISYIYNYLFCRALEVEFYQDLNGDCVKEANEPFSNIPFSTEVDSNGVSVDTVSATSGFYYSAHGNPGTIYSFKPISPSAGLMVSCPSSGIIYDTLAAIMYNDSTKYFGLSCTSSGYDLAVYVSMLANQTYANAEICIDNTYCTPENATVTMNINPQYVFSSAYPTPTSVVGNTVTWSFDSVAATMVTIPHIHVTMTTPGTVLLAGDTIHTNYSVSPTIGDLDTANNFSSTVDTVRASYDPNFITVTPQGVITAGTELQYAIEFENTGNDTAFNIYIMDTLSAYVIPSSLKIVAATATMNVASFNDGTNNIVKFNFPKINLPDSSYHDQCEGMVVFSIKTRAGLPVGTIIPAWAGIFFDDNPVVTTDTVYNIIGSIPVSVANPRNEALLDIFPNPATNLLTIQSTNNPVKQITINNILGQMVYTNECNSPEVQVDISTYPAGVYFIKINGSEVRKFVKE